MIRGSARQKDPLKELLKQIGISAALAGVVLLFTQDFLLDLAPLKRLELSTIDYRFHLRGPVTIPQESLKVVIVDISQESFEALPDKWPWPRSYYAGLLRNLKRAGALAVGFDIVFSEEDAYNRKNDEEFRKALRETRIGVLAGKTQIETGQYVLRKEGENYNNIFFHVDSSLGIVYVPKDDDGVVRKCWPMNYDIAYQLSIPTFPFAVLNKAFGRTPFYVARDEPDEFVYAVHRIPKFDSRSMLINYYGAHGTFRHIKFADVLDDQTFLTEDERKSGEQINTFDDPDFGYLYDGTFAGKIVLVGSTDPEAQDLHPVPIAEQGGGNLMYGVEIHANTIQNVLDGTFFRKEPPWLEIVSVFFFCALSFLATTKLKEVRFRYHIANDLLGALVSAVQLGIIAVVSVQLFSNYAYVTVWTSPSLAVVFGFVGATTYNYVMERKQKVLIKGMFSQYVSPTVVDEIVAHPEKLRLGGERKELTVLFSDIAGFTTISESLKPEELVTLLNDYLSAMTALIFANAGTLDKYEGDAIMAFWGAPVPQSDHALRACRTAFQMQEALRGLRELWREEGKPSIDVRIGLSTGEMVVGNMGGSRRFDYTVIGDTVNLGSRLEGANKEYRTEIMISEITYRHVKDHVVARHLDLLVVKGKTEPIAVYELVGFVNDNVSQKYLDFLHIYNQGLEHYRNREWSAAMRAFQKASEMSPNDYPSFMYFKRAKEYSLNPPLADWNGVYVLTSK